MKGMCIAKRARRDDVQLGSKSGREHSLKVRPKFIPKRTRQPVVNRRHLNWQSHRVPSLVPVGLQSHADTLVRRFQREFTGGRFEQAINSTVKPEIARTPVQSKVTVGT